MAKKNIIYIIATIVVLLIIGYIAYRGFFAGSSESGLNISVEEVAPVAPILSEGTTLDFKKVNEYNDQEQLFNYPKPSPDEMNLPLQDLIK